MLKFAFNLLDDGPHGPAGVRRGGDAAGLHDRRGRRGPRPVLEKRDPDWSPSLVNSGAVHHDATADPAPAPSRRSTRWPTCAPSPTLRGRLGSRRRGRPDAEEVLRAIVHAGGLVNAVCRAPDPGSTTHGSTTHGNTTHGNTAPLLGAAVLTLAPTAGLLDDRRCPAGQQRDRGIGSAPRSTNARGGRTACRRSPGPSTCSSPATGTSTRQAPGPSGRTTSGPSAGRWATSSTATTSSDRLVAVWSTTAPTPSRTESPSRSDHSASLLAGPTASRHTSPARDARNAGCACRPTSSRPVETTHDGHPLAAGRAGGDGGRLRPTLRGDRGQPRPLVSLHPCPGPEEAR